MIWFLTPIVMADPNGYSLAQIDDFISALVENASSLISDAKTLFVSDAYARAHALAHLAREEISRILILQAAAARILGGIPVDWKKTKKRLRDHKVKIIQETIDSVVFLAALGDENGSEMLLNFTPAVANYRNERKNAALYVNFEDGKPILPNSVFSRVQADRCIQLAELALKNYQEMAAKAGHFAGRTPFKIEDPEIFLNANPGSLHDIVKALAPIYSMLISGNSSPYPRPDSSSSEIHHPPS